MYLNWQTYYHPPNKHCIFDCYIPYILQIYTRTEKSILRKKRKFGKTRKQKAEKEEPFFVIAKKVKKANNRVYNQNGEKKGKDEVGDMIIEIERKKCVCFLESVIM